MRRLNLRPRRKRSGEISFEGDLTKELERVDVWFIKIKPTRAGFPDRLAMAFPCHYGLVELKGWDGELSEVQKQVHKELYDELGIRVLVLKKKSIHDAAREVLSFLYSNG